MAAASDYLEDILFNWYFRGVAHTPPATFYVGLFTAAPTDAGGGTEVTGGGYARAAITRATGSWTAASGGERLRNKRECAFIWDYYWGMGHRRSVRDL